MGEHFPTYALGPFELDITTVVAVQGASNAKITHA